MVDAVASADPNGTLAIVVWNGTVDVTKAGGDQRLDRDVRLTIADLPAAMYRIRHRRLDEQHSNINATWSRIADGRPWPDDGSWRTLIAENHLADLVPPSDVRPHGGTIDLRFALPMPAVSLIELAPA